MTRFAWTRFALAAVAVALVAGCEESRSFLLSDGSRATGTVTMSCDYEWLVACKPLSRANKSTAAHVCRKWGYKSAELDAIQSTPYDSESGRIEIEFRCSGTR